MKIYNSAVSFLYNNKLQNSHQIVLSHKNNIQNQSDACSFKGNKYLKDNRKIIDSAYEWEDKTIEQLIDSASNNNLTDEVFLDKLKEILIKGLSREKEFLTTKATVKEKLFSNLGSYTIDYFSALFNKESTTFQPESFLIYPDIVKRSLNDKRFYLLLRKFSLENYNKNYSSVNIEKKGRAFYKDKVKEFPLHIQKSYITSEEEENNYAVEKNYYAKDYFGILASKFIEKLKEYHRQLELKKAEETKVIDQSVRSKAEVLLKIQNAREHLLYDYIQNISICKELNSINPNALQDLIPNSIVIAHSQKNIRDEVLNWLIVNTNCNKSKITNTNELDHKKLAAQIRGALEDNEKIFQETGRPGFIYIENFENFIKNTVPKFKLAAFKTLLEKTWSQYHSTIVFTTNDISSLDNISKQPHRSMVLDIEKDPIIERLKPLKDENMSNFRDGLRIKYGSEKDHDYVDVYLGCFGTARDILWVDSKYTGDVKIILDNMNLIKQRSQFKDVSKIQCACEDTNRLLALGFKPLNDVDKEGSRIFEKKI